MEISDSSLSNFTTALQEYERATGKDAVEILNRAALNVAYRAAQFTPVATAAEIKSTLFRDPKLVYALTSISLKKQGIGRLGKGEFQREVQKFIARRVGSRRYLRSGWAPAIISLGGTFRGVKTENESYGYADKASVGRLVAEIANIVKEPNTHKQEGAEEVEMLALQEALDFVAGDMLDYAQRKLAKTATLFSP